MLSRIAELFLFGLGPLLLALIALPGPSPAEERMIQQTQEPAEDSLFGTTWLAEDIEGAGVIDFAQSTLTVTQDGRVAGIGACNNYFANAIISGASIEIAEIGSTRKACPPAAMDQERKFFEALRRAKSFRFDGGKLFLVDDKGRDIVRLSHSA
jgi:putative lipoprotein